MTNRRGFLKSMLAAGVSAMILPGAGRQWIKSAQSPLYTVNPAWVNAEYEISFWINNAKIFEDRYHFLPVVFKRAEGPPAVDSRYHVVERSFPLAPVRLRIPYAVESGIVPSYIVVTR